MTSARVTLDDIRRRLIAAEEADRPLLPATPPVAPRTVCVAMATYDDFDGVWFTVQSVLMHQPEVSDDVSFVVIDNHPRGASAAALKALDVQVPNLRYVPFDGYCGTSVRDLLFRETAAEIVCCVDAHVLLAPGALRALIDHFAEPANARDLVHGPLLGGAGGRVSATHMTPEWSALMFGRWSTDAAAYEQGEPFEIPMHGLGLFACRREAWPGFNPRFRGFGAEEGYLHEKVRRAGGRVLCHPRVGWAHRFERPAGAPYRTDLRERLRNYRLAWEELGWDPRPIEDHFRRRRGDDHDVNEAIRQVGRDLRSPFARCDAVLVPVGTGERVDEVVTALDEVDAGWLVERVDIGVPRDGDDAVIRRRAALRWARHRGYRDVVVVDADAELPADIGRRLAAAWSSTTTRGPTMVALADGAHLIRECAGISRSGEPVEPPPTAGSPVPIEVTTFPIEPVMLPSPAAARFPRAVVAVLLARDHLPFIRAWCLHHLDQGWAVHLLDNTGSVGAVRLTSEARRDLVAARDRPPAHHRFTAHLDDEEVAAALRAAVHDLPVAVIPWRPHCDDGAIVHAQAEAYARFVEAYRATVEWAAFIDADEYLVSGPGCDWDDLLERVSGAGSGRIVLDGVRYESRWDPDGTPRELTTLRPAGLQDGGSKNIVRLADVTRTDLHWAWELGDNRIHARPDPAAYGFRHYRAECGPPPLRLSDRQLATWIDESVAVAPSVRVAGLPSTV